MPSNTPVEAVSQCEDAALIADGISKSHFGRAPGEVSVTARADTVGLGVAFDDLGMSYQSWATLTPEAAAEIGAALLRAAGDASADADQETVEYRGVELPADGDPAMTGMVDLALGGGDGE